MIKVLKFNFKKYLKSYVAIYSIIVIILLFFLNIYLTKESLIKNNSGVYILNIKKTIENANQKKLDTSLINNLSFIKKLTMTLKENCTFYFDKRFSILNDSIGTWKIGSLDIGSIINYYPKNERQGFSSYDYDNVNNELIISTYQGRELIFNKNKMN